MLFFFIKICLIYIFDIDQLEKKLQRKQSGVKHHKPLQRNLEDMLNYSSICNCSWNLNLFWLAIIHWESIREISNFSNSSHLELRMRLSHTIFERDQGPKTITARYGVIFQWFQKIDLNVKSLGRTTDGCKKMAIIHINDKGTDDDTNVNSFINHFMYVFIWHQGEFVYKWFLLFLLSWQHIWLL